MHMSVGFPIPMIMVDPREVLERHEIASVVANFGTWPNANKTFCTAR